MTLFEKIKEKKWELALVSSLIFLGIFLRTYHFSSWLHFEIDQTYDTNLVSPAVQNGISNLPLLGPTAGGGRSLRLGPAFYYLEYLGAKTFGDNPQGHASTVLFFSLLSLPLFYIFSKRYFSTAISLVLLALFSSSLYMVLYSRFSWSPNILPFFILLTLYALLKSTGTEEKNNNLWFLIMAASAAVITQIHFVAFFTVPAIIAVFLIIKRPKLKLRTWIGALGIFIILYAPVIISEIETGGQDISFFSERISGISGGDNQKTALPSLVQDMNYSVLENFLITSGVDEINGPHYKGYALGIKFKALDSKDGWKFLALFIFLSEIFLLARKYFQEKEREKKDFLLICILWLAFSLFAYFYILQDGLYLYPRFFLLISPLSFILLGLIFDSILSLRTKIPLAAVLIISSLIAYSNTSKIISHFNGLREVGQIEEKMETEDIFPNNNRLTFQQQILVTDYIESKFNQNHYPIYLKSKHEYQPVFWYYFQKRDIPYFEDIGEKIYEKGNYFLVLPSYDLSPDDIEKYQKKFDIGEEKYFGSLSVYYLTPKKDSVASEENTATPGVTTQSKQISEILTWNKLFSSK